LPHIQSTTTMFGGSMGFGSGGSGSISSSTDVALNTPALNEQLVYNTSTQKWQNGPVASYLIETVRTVATSGAAQTIPDVSTATVHNITLTANCTFTFPVATAGKSFTIRLTQGSGGFTATWPVSVAWPSGTAPVVTTTAGKRDFFSFTCTASGEWFGFVAGQNY